MATNYFGNNNQGLQIGQSTAPIHANIHIAPAHPESPPRSTSTIIPRADAAFVNREDLLSLVRTQAAVKGARLALVGLGGVGKTQTAIHYAKSEQDAGTWVLWLFASNEARFDESIRDVADQLRLPGRQEPRANVLQLIRAWLTDSKRRWLVVLDNVDDAEFLLVPCSTADAAQASKCRIDYVPACDHGTVIVTSRSKNEARKLVDEHNVIEVTAMDAVSGRLLLQKKLGTLYANESAVQLAAALDFMPLALSQAASFIKHKRSYTVAKYLAQLEESRESRTGLLGRHGTVARRAREASSSIMRTWQISFDHIHTARKSAADLLALMSCCSRQSIPEILLYISPNEQNSAYVGVAEDEAYDTRGSKESFDDDIQILEDFSFISPTPDMAGWTMHRLVQDAMQQWLLDRRELIDVQHRLTLHLNAVTPGGDYEDWNTCRILAPHISTALEFVKSQPAHFLPFVQVLDRSAYYEARGGSLAVAARLGEMALSIRRDYLQEDNKAVIWAEAVMAEIHRESGRLQQAEELGCKVLAARKTLLGEEHPETLWSMHSLARTNLAQGRYNDAIELEEKVLALNRRVLGEEHHDTLASMGNLASIYYEQTRYEESAELQLQVLRAMERVLGSEHPSTLTTMTDLASVYSAQDRHEDAVRIHSRVLEVKRRLYQEEHPRILSSMHDLALLYCNQGSYQNAAELLTKVLESMTRVLGEEHPSTLMTMSNLATTYFYLNRLQEALMHSQKCLQLRINALGQAHPHIRHSRDLVERCKTSLLINEVVELIPGVSFEEIDISNWRTM